MSITINTLSYDEDSFVNPNRVTYTGPSHTFSTQDILTLARTAPKPSATSDGVARASAKRTKTVTLANGNQAVAIVEVNCAFPVGMAKADADALRDDIGDLAISSTGDTLFWNHDIRY